MTHTRERRRFLRRGICVGAHLGVTVGVGASGLLAALPARAQIERWGADQGYPTGWSAGYSGMPTRVGNYSGGFERMLPSHLIRATPTSALAAERQRPVRFEYPWGQAVRSADDYLTSYPITSLLIARKGEMLYERYAYSRTPAMRLTGWSMSKSVTSMLLGIALDKGLIASIDRPAEDYAPDLRDTLHGQVTLRHLINMSSGAAVVHDQDNQTRIYPRGLIGQGSDLEAVVKGWDQRAEPAGQRFNYNELCALTIGMVLRRVSGMSLAEFAQRALWQPMGARADATWQCDRRGHEFNCVGFAATARDWLRLGQLIAQRGTIDGTRVLSEKWIEECCAWGDLDQQVRYGAVRADVGYKAFFWHLRSDGSRPCFIGHHGQRLIIDRPSQTVLLQTAVDDIPGMFKETAALFQAAVETSG